MTWAFFVLLGGLFIGAANVALKVATVKSIGFAPISLYFFTVGCGMLGYAIHKNGTAGILANLQQPDGIKFTLLAAVAGLLSNLALYTGLVTAPASIGFTIYNVAATLCTVSLSILLLHEKLSPIHLAGVACAVLSVLLLTWKTS